MKKSPHHAIPHILINIYHFSFPGGHHSDWGETEFQVLLIHIFLMTKGFERNFKCLLAICISSPESCMSISLDLLIGRSV